MSCIGANCVIGSSRNGAGLAGHNQLKHRSEHSAVALEERQRERPEHSAVVPQERQLEGLVQLLEQHLEPIGEALDVLLSKTQHTHGGEPNCGSCHDALHAIGAKSWEEGFAEAVARLAEIPGVTFARVFNKWANEHMTNHPGHPVVSSLEDIPGVKEAIERYQIGNVIITIKEPVESPSMEQIIGLFR